MALLGAYPFKEDLWYKSYGLRKGQFMLEKTKLQQLEKVHKPLSRLKHLEKGGLAP